MSDLTENQVAAQEGAFEPPENDVPVLQVDELDLEPDDFIVHVVEAFEPNRGPTGYGLNAVQYHDKLAAYADHRRELRRRRADAAPGSIDSRLIDPATRELE